MIAAPAQLHGALASLRRMAVNRSAPLALILLLTACSGVNQTAPSLARRPAEAIDPRLPIADQSDDGVISAPLGAKVVAIIDRARASTGQFDAAIAVAERLAASAGPRQSESWIAAQQALSAAIAARAPVSTAVGDLDALIEDQVRKGIRRADLSNATGGAENLSALDRRQAAQVDTVQQRLDR